LIEPILYFICLDTDCAFFNQCYPSKRSSFKAHTENKYPYKIKNLLKFYHVTTIPEIFNDITLINMYVDCCRGKTARMLIDKFHRVNFKNKNIGEYF